MTDDFRSLRALPPRALLGPALLLLAASSAPAQLGGDTCSTATVVAAGSHPFDNTGASSSLPAACDPDLTGDLWFLHTPPADGVLSIRTCESVGLLDDTVLVVHDGGVGCPIPSSPALACDDDGCGTFGFHSEVVVPVLAGQPLLIQVGGWNGTVGDGVLTIEAIEGDCANGLDEDGDGLTDCLDPDCASSPLCPAVNDECSGAVAIGLGSSPFENTNAPVDGPLVCDPDISGDLWFLHTPADSGLLSVATCSISGTLGDTVLVAYDGTAGCPGPTGAALACDDDACGSQSELLVPVTAGVPLLIQVGGRGGSVGDGVLRLERREGSCADGLDDDGDGLIDCDDPDCDLDPACDELDCSDGIDGDGDGLTDCADPDCAGETVCEEFANCADGIDNDLDGLVDCADPECAASPVCLPIAPNDLCADATPVIEGQHLFSNLNAPLPGAVFCDPDLTGDVWFLFTASDDGWISIRTCDGPGTLEDTVLGIYDGGGGCPTTTASILACDDDSCGVLGVSSREDLFVLGGQALYIQVGGWNGTVGTGTLTIERIEVACFDGLDEDADGLIDCADPDCLIACDEGANCGDGIDNDGDGLVDCADGDCAGSGVCSGAPAPPTGLGCFDGGGSLIDLAWVPAAGGAGITSQRITRDGVLVTTVAPGIAAASIPYPPGSMGPTVVCVESVGPTGTSSPECCTLTLGIPLNDDCGGALVVGLGDTPFDNSGATPGAVPAVCDPGIGRDLWFQHTATFDGSLSIRTCAGQAGALDPIIVVHAGGGGCPGPLAAGLACDDDGCGPGGLGAEVIVTVSVGDSLLIQLGSAGGTSGAGTLTLAEDCGLLTPLDCIHEPALDTVTLSWSANPSIAGAVEVLDNGVLVATVPAGGGTTISIVAPTPGAHTYELQWSCALTGAAGPTASCDLFVEPEIPDGTTAVIVAKERLSGPFPGAIDSGAALEAALIALGEQVHTIVAPDLDSLGLDFSGVGSIWVCLGTFPDDSRLTAAEGDWLAALNEGGVALYLESSDHWGFLHLPSALDARDGHLTTAEIDGDDSFVSMAAAGGGGWADLTGSFPAIVGYLPDQPFETTDRLVADPADPGVSSVEAIWVQGGQGYVTGIAARHTIGAPSIVQSWEFGGFPASGQVLLASRYRELLELPSISPSFERGNCNADGTFNIADAIFLLGALFPPPGGGSAPICPAACDGNDDGVVNIADAVFLLSVLFPPVGGGGVVPPPTVCGPDPTVPAAGPLPCPSFPPCVP